MYFPLLSVCNRESVYLLTELYAREMVMNIKIIVSSCTQKRYCHLSTVAMAFLRFVDTTIVSNEMGGYLPDQTACAVPVFVY